MTMSDAGSPITDIWNPGPDRASSCSIRSSRSGRAKANSHQGRGWERFTDRIIELVAAKQTRVVFVLWGREAQKKRTLITQSHHTVIATAHIPRPCQSESFSVAGASRRSTEILPMRGWLRLTGRFQTSSRMLKKSASFVLSSSKSSTYP